MKVQTDSNIGLCRAENQDIVKSECIGDSVFVVLCDGMGGQNSGLDASSITADVVLSKFIAGYEDGFSSNSIRNLMISTVSIANSIVYNTAYTDPDKLGMGSTCVAAFVNARTGTAHIVNVGDSRAYLCSEDGIEQITTDHSFVQMLMDRGEITEEEKNAHPKKNMLIRAVGVEKDIAVDYFETELGDARLLLCSDGLHGYCTSDEILEYINEVPLEDAVEKLVNLALAKGGYDNITLAVVEDG
ncbi:MAG: SpoIIE family protein phosphatase [Oscillospiraceae bacterium]|nr:SpoIIE family protein phosphatase [Oscillospiraceae bacterium]